jgi:hypothetical protein
MCFNKFCDVTITVCVVLHGGYSLHLTENIENKRNIMADLFKEITLN